MQHQSDSVCSSSPSSLNVTPSSSPAFGPVDSSPPSSPALVPYELGDPFLSLSHPFAASTKSTKRPPHYEKKADSPPCTPPGIFGCADVRRGPPTSRSLQRDYYGDHGSPNSSPTSHRTSRYIDRDETLWDDALRTVFDKGLGQIDLSNQQLKYIPASIGDLSGFFNTSESSEHGLFPGRVMTRVNTEPPRARSFNRAQSIKEFGKERHVLKLYLMGNMITSLPPELFLVQHITVLSLRGNRLTFIPPDICRLTNLHELNISNNQLKFLPWQMRDMKVETLLVHPNPFLPEPVSSSGSSLRSHRSIVRLHSLRKEALSGPTPTKPVLSPVTLVLGRTPPLTELCFRLLLAPSEHSPTRTVIADYYGLPLSDQWIIPPSIYRTLAGCVPGMVRPRKRFSNVMTLDDRSPGTGTKIGTCPNPTHWGRVFVKHASERFSWERRVAGVDVGGAVPLKWLGCLGTCLDFLDAESEVPAGLPAPAAVVTMQGGKHDDDDGMDVEMAVQVVDLGSVSLDLDDFGD